MTAFRRVGAAPLSGDSTSFMVRMRDGVRLATDVYLRDGSDAAPGPTILIRLPYDKVGEYTFIPDIARYMTGRGYHVVAQDVRGKFRSEGETLLFVNEAADGYDTIEWVTQQPWSDGSVAMWGDSYYGYTQWAAVSSAHPALKAIAPRVTGTRLGERPVDQPGELVRDVEMGVALMYPLSHFHTNDTFEWMPEWSRRPYTDWVEEFVDSVGERSPSFDLWYPRPVMLRRFPFGHPLDQPPVPVLHTIGWWDNCAPWSWDDHAEIQKRPRWALHEYLLIESIDHENYFLDDPHRDAERSDEARDVVIRAAVDPALEFFDVFVRGIGRAADVPRVRWHLANTDEVRTAESWPLPDARSLILAAGADGTLTREAPPQAETVVWTHDPAHPVPSSVPNAFAFLLDKPDEAPLGEHESVVVFTSDAFEADTDLAGPVTATARVGSSGPTMDVFVRLLDVAPDGTALRIARGQVHITDAAVDRDVTIDMGHLGYRLAAGHRLRLHLSSSDFPEFVIQPGTGEDPWSATRTERNDQRVQVGGAQGLRLQLAALAGDR